ncbi:hypothetical protein INT48_005264, partial [Thamnidium elegans]
EDDLSANTNYEEASEAKPVAKLAGVEEPEKEEDPEKEEGPEKSYNSIPISISSNWHNLFTNNKILILTGRFTAFEM